MKKSGWVGFGVAAALVVGVIVAYAVPGDNNADLVLGQPDFTSRTLGLTAAKQNAPLDVVVDGDGNVYVVDNDNHRVLGWSAAAVATGASATLVIGQADFVSGTANRGGAPGAGTLNSPTGAVVDAAGNLYVADGANNRVLEYDTPFAIDPIADRVFGQPNFTSAMPNQGGGTPTTTTLALPRGLGFGAGVLFVADTANNRVLGFDGPLANQTADLVFGQGNFTSNGGGTTPNTLFQPTDAALDGSGNLYVVDFGNSRVLLYNAPLATTGQAAAQALGQPNLTSGGANNPSLSATSLAGPFGLSLDATGNLYVADLGNNRALKYSPPITTQKAADLVFGQPDFASNTCNFGLPVTDTGANRLCAPAGAFVDGNADLWLADTGNNRTLRFDQPVIPPTPTPTNTIGPTPTNTIGPSPTPSATPTPTVPPKICNGLPATIVGTSVDELIIGTETDDVIHGKGGNDIIKGRGGADIICGGSGNDTIRGGGSSDFLKGGSGNDFLKGGGDNDVLLGNKDDDTLVGGNGDDTCIDDKGSNTFSECEDVQD